MLFAAGRRKSDFVSLVFANHRPRYRRVVGNQAGVDIGLVFADDRVSRVLFRLHVEQFDGRTENDLPLIVDRRDIDNVGIGKLGFDVLDSCFDKALLFLRRVILRVFPEVAVRARLADCLRNLAALLIFQLVQFFA